MIQQLIAAAKYMPDETGVAFARAKQIGYEIPGFVEPAVLENPGEHIKRWQALLAGVKGPLGLHGPVYDLNPVSLDPKITETSRLRYRQAVDVAKAFGCRFLVIHSQYSTLFAVANIKREWLQASVDFWRQFAEEQLEDSPSLCIMLENFMENEPEQLRALIDGINHPQIKACLDTGHANLFSKASLTAWLDALEHQVAYVHAHNNHGQWDEHRGFAHGTLEMDRFINNLVMSPYKVNLALEVFNEQELEESYQVVQRFLTIQEEHLPEKTFLI